MTDYSVNTGMTYKSKTEDHTFYTTINHNGEGEVIELFVRINDPEFFEIIQLVTRFSSMLLQSGTDARTIAKELKDIHSPKTRHMIPKTDIMCPSIIARIGYILEDHLNKMEQKCKSGTKMDRV